MIDSDESHRESMWGHCLKFASASEVAEAISSLGSRAASKLERPPLELAQGSRTYFEIVWSRLRVDPAGTTAEWANVAEAMGLATSLVNQPLSNGRLPLSEMMAWGAPFRSARGAFARAGANCWKKDRHRRSAVDEARRLGLLTSEPWLALAMKLNDPLDTDDAKKDLKSDDIGWARGPTSSEEWGRRFKWESARGASTFDTECLWLLTKRFSPSEALAVGIEANGVDGLEPEALSGWIVRCLLGGMGGLPAPDEIRRLCRGADSGSRLASMLGWAIIDIGVEDGSSKDAKRSGRLIDSLMAACDLCGVDFEPAAQVLAKEALGWTMPCQYSADPYAQAPAGKQLLAALSCGRAQWEARSLSASLAQAAPRPRSARL